MLASPRQRREQQLLQLLRMGSTRLHSEYRRVMSLEAEGVIPLGTPGALLIAGILDREFNTEREVAATTAKVAAAGPSPE